MRRYWALWVVIAVVALTPGPAGAASESWQADGPEGFAAFCLAQAADGTILAGVDWGLVRYSKGTGSWEQLGPDGDSFGPLFVASNGVMFAQVSYRGCMSSTSNKVSFDGGLSWEEAVGLPDVGGIVAFAETPDGTVWTSTSMSDNLYRWDPVNTEWTRHFPMISSASINDMAVTSNGTLLVLVSTYDWPESAILRSDDGGASWSIPLVEPVRLATLAAGPDGLVVAGSQRAIGQDLTFFVSLNEGLSWSERPCADAACLDMQRIARFVVLDDGSLVAAGEDADGRSSRLIVADAPDRPWRIAGRYENTPSELLVDREGDLWIAGIPYVWRSTDGGTTFEHVADGLIETSVTDLTETGGRILAVVGGGIRGGYSGWIRYSGAAGIHASSDGGMTWAPTEVWQANQLSVGRSGSALAATDRGVMRSVDGGVSWQTVAESSEISVLAVAEDLDGTLCLISSAHVLSCTADGGSSWYGDLELENQYSALTVTLDGIFLVESFHTVLRSVDRGHTWQPTSLTEDVDLFAVSPENEVYAIIGLFAEREIALSNDSGLTWRVIETPAAHPSALAFHPVYGLVIGNGYQAFYSPDRRLTWRQIDIPAEALLVHGNRLVGGSSSKGVWLADFPSRSRRGSGRTGP